MSAFVTDGPDLPLTGERTVPGLAEENYWFRRHEVVYRRLAGRCAGRDVLEAGCGEGYGADLIADHGRDRDRELQRRGGREARRGLVVALVLALGSAAVLIADGVNDTKKSGDTATSSRQKTVAR